MREKTLPPIIVQTEVVGGRHRRPMPEPLQQGETSPLSEQVKSDTIVALDQAIGDTIYLRPSDVPEGFHPSDLPQLSPRKFARRGEADGQKEVVTEAEAVRLQGTCDERCVTSWNPEPWRSSRRLRRLQKHVGPQTLSREGEITSGVVYHDQNQPPPPERHFEKTFDESTGEVIYEDIIQEETPPMVKKVVRRRKKPQPSEDEFAEKLKAGLPLTVDNLPF